MSVALVDPHLELRDSKPSETFLRIALEESENGMPVIVSAPKPWLVYSVDRKSVRLHRCQQRLPVEQIVRAAACQYVAFVATTLEGKQFIRSLDVGAAAKSSSTPNGSSEEENHSQQGGQ